MKSDNEVALGKMLFDIQELGGLELLQLNRCDTQTLLNNLQELQQTIIEEQQ